MLILHETYDHWSVAVLTVTEHFIYSHFWFFVKLVAFCTEFNLFTHICFVLFMIMDLPYICDHQVGYSAGGYSLSPRWFLTWYIYPFFSGLAALMSADIARNLWSLVCSCLNSYWTFHLFPLLIFCQIGCFLHWIQSVYPHLFCSLYDNGSPLYLTHLRKIRNTHLCFVFLNFSFLCQNSLRWSKTRQTTLHHWLLLCFDGQRKRLYSLFPNARFH